MHKRYGKYKRYRRRYRYYYRNQSSILEDLLEIIITIIVKLGFSIGKLIFNLFKLIRLTSQKKQKTLEVKINRPFHVLETEIRPQVRTQTQVNVDQKYSLKLSFLTPAENIFLNILKQIVGDHYIIECQIQLSRFVNVNDSNAHFTNYHDFNKIKAKSIDFLLLNKENKPYLAIELDDRTHSRWDRIKRDLFVDDVMKQIGLPILHVRATYPDSYNFEELKNQIFQFSNISRDELV